MREFSFDAGPVSLNIATGPDNGPPLVLLHGVTRRWQDFNSILPALSLNHRVLGVDLRGHGRSGRVPGAYRVIDYVNDVVELIRETADEPVVLIGHSLGSMVAAAVAARAPDRVRTLVLEDPTFEMTARRIREGTFLDLFHAFQPHAGSQHTVSAIARELGQAPIYLPGRSETVTLGSLRNEVALRFSAACLKQLDRDVLTPAIAEQWLDGYDVPTTLNSLKCPTLLLQGDFSAGGALPDPYATELASLIPGCVHIRVPGVGHNIHAENAEAMLRLVLPFLSSLD